MREYTFAQFTIFLDDIARAQAEQAVAHLHMTRAAIASVFGGKEVAEEVTKALLG